MDKLLVSAVKTARPTQWIKNLVIFAALVFAGDFFDKELFIKTSLGFVAFSLLASSIYFLNDIVDLKQDRSHPLKKNRPIARGALPIPVAIFISLVGIISSLYLSSLISLFFFLPLVSYFILQVIYTFWLKTIVVADIFSIATGFVLRIYAGVFLVDAHLPVWFLLCVISVSLFLAAGKRRAELAALAKNPLLQSRKSLNSYSLQLLDSYLAMFATASWVSWALFTFFTEEERAFYISRAIPPSLLNNLPLAILGSGKLLMLTIPLVIFGVMRYLFIIYRGSRAEAPEKVILTDKTLITTVFLWILIVFFVIYGLPKTP